MIDDECEQEEGGFNFLSGKSLKDALYQAESDLERFKQFSESAKSKRRMRCIRDVAWIELQKKNLDQEEAVYAEAAKEYLLKAYKDMF
jgi:hypothetical protein